MWGDLAVTAQVGAVTDVYAMSGGASIALLFGDEPIDEVNAGFVPMSAYLVGRPSPLCCTHFQMSDWVFMNGLDSKSPALPGVGQP